MWACDNGSLDVVKVLIDNGSNVHDRDKVSSRFLAILLMSMFSKGMYRTEVVHCHGHVLIVIWTL